MKTSRENPGLVGKIRVLLDGEDVTDNCSAFDVAAGKVQIYERNPRGRVTIEHHCCSCGHVAERVAGTFTDPLCAACGERTIPRAKQVIVAGHVEILPVSPT